MKDIIDWLSKVEEVAAEIYRQSAVYCRDDRVLSSFLTSLARDEEYHHGIMQKARAVSEKKKINDNGLLAVDDETKRNVEAPLNVIKDMVEKRDMNKELLLESLIKAECSEWNSIFLYVIRSLKQEGRQLQHDVSMIQHHEKKIESFIKSYPLESNIVNIVSALPQVWDEKVLIVDDSQAVREFLEALLKKELHIEAASNGKEAFSMANRNYYNLIISDIDMPLMDGLKLYEKLASIYPDINRRFMFFSSDCSFSDTDFQDVLCLSKPASISQIRDAVSQIREMSETGI